MHTRGHISGRKPETCPAAHQPPSKDTFHMLTCLSMKGMAVPVGNVFGITLNASLTERFGHKRILIGALIFLSGLITIQFRATSIEQLFIGQILCGVPWGAFTTMAPAYSSEVAPLALRSYLETWVSHCPMSDHKRAVLICVRLSVVGELDNFSVMLSYTVSTTGWTSGPIESLLLCNGSGLPSSVSCYHVD